MAASRPAKTGKRDNARPSAGKVLRQARAPRAVKAKISTRRAAARVIVEHRPSIGEIQGLRNTDDPLDLKSSVALVIDQDTDQILFSKNPDAVLPIASITKLMTAMVVTASSQDLDEPLTVTADDIDTRKGSRSRLSVGTRLSRGEMLHLALMSSENRAANALGRHYPGGLPAFVAAMNETARRLGMSDTHYVEPTGLSSMNRSSARDLSLLVKAAYQQPLIRELSTTPEAEFAVGRKAQQFRNTNGLVRNPEWDIGLQKTGYISEAGRCLVMQAELAGRKLIMVLLDSAGKYSRIGDAERLRHWLLGESPAATGAGAAHRGG
ncbi:MAG TPA: D-alanyl-D-alanine endopeptidase [Rubrivivax sp.]|nr:D-alanyl-D-alanine endopeptidase [Burkholderiales bacterium]HNU12151.1 D-alanyl-D-alanine endopeptidase [Rubrivivax sp.]